MGKAMREFSNRDSNPIMSVTKMIGIAVSKMGYR